MPRDGPPSSTASARAGSARGPVPRSPGPVGRTGARWLRWSRKLPLSASVRRWRCCLPRTLRGRRRTVNPPSLRSGGLFGVLVDARRLPGQQSPEGERQKHHGPGDGEQVGRPGDPSEPRGPVAYLDVAERAHGRTAPAATTRALLTLPAADAAAASEPESRLRHGDHRDPLALYRLAEDGRDHRLLPDRLGDSLQQLVGGPQALLHHRHRRLLRRRVTPAHRSPSLGEVTGWAGRSGAQPIHSGLSEARRTRSLRACEAALPLHARNAALSDLRGLSALADDCPSI